MPNRLLHGGMRRVTKAITLLTFLACPLHAALIAHVQTTLGTVHVELQHATAPKAVANFMTLAQGTRSRVNPITGAATTDPLYVGEKFFRTLNNAAYKFAQTGSGTGTPAGQSGFTFQDEFTPSVRHTGYTLSSANAGPNTNNGQIFFTGNLTIPSYDDVHSIIGLIPDAASRTVIDAIINAGDNGSTITGITFERTDPAANAFNELAQGLPEVVRPFGKLEVTPGVSAIWKFDAPITTGTIFRAFRSNLPNGTWAELEDASLQLGILSHPQVASATQATIETEPGVQGFYQLTVARHSGAIGPTTLVDRTVAFAFGGGTLSYAFDATGKSGILTYTPASGGSSTSSFTTVNPSDGTSLAPYSLGAHNINFVADTVNGSPRYYWVKVGCDSISETVISGHHSTQTFGIFGWQPFVKGTCTVTR
ncbi:peptidylprolyl isomerase [Luteolibacter arcticus]|uniref:peptidylprolyl isomerase n=1 Tax=Luteolibacter arcticus TaxID=1581411 RepID=A0ABT3GKZ0_9BACT|nr:peptidylprolyl isomerase [Luteolibacter arcticus]MCW1924177.1 peptidylprolyl isomerase [Luteolibacter arcticus]